MGGFEVNDSNMVTSSDEMGETEADGGTWHFLRRQGRLVCCCLMSSRTTLMRGLNPLSSSFQKEAPALNSSPH